MVSRRSETRIEGNRFVEHAAFRGDIAHAVQSQGEIVLSANVFGVFLNCFPVGIDGALNFAGFEIFVGLVRFDTRDVALHGLLGALLDVLQFFTGFLFLTEFPQNLCQLEMRLAGAGLQLQSFLKLLSRRDRFP